MLEHAETIESESRAAPVGSKAPAGVVLESRPCPLGCRADDETVLVGRDRFHNLPGDFRIVRCRTCGLMRTDPRPTQATIGFYYPQDYAPYLATRIEDDEAHDKLTNGMAEGAARSSLRRRVSRALKTVVGWQYDTALPPASLTSSRLASPASACASSKRALEIGCASGAFLTQLKRAGWHVEGIEFDEAAAARAREHGFKVHGGALETAPAPAEPFELVVGWMVLEHLHEPVAALRKLRAWTKPGARLALSVPNAASREFAVFREDWYALHLPAHLYYFTPQTLARVLAAGGWQVERVLHQRNINNLLCSLGNRLEARGLFSRLAARLKSCADGGRAYYLFFPVAYLLSLFGQTGRMTVWASREDD